MDTYHGDTLLYTPKMSLYLDRYIIALFLMAVSSYCKNPCEENMSEFMPSAIIREDGSAWDPETFTLYPKGTYWFLPNSTIPMGCPCKVNQLCLRKCCQIGQVMTSSMDCISRNTTYSDGGAWFRPQLADVKGSKALSVNGTERKLGILTEKHCFPKSRSTLVREDFFIRSKDTKLCYIIGSELYCVGIDQFCLDYLEDEGRYLPVQCPWIRRGWAMRYVHTALENNIFSTFKILTQTVSSLALCIVLGMYIYAPSLRTIHGKCHMCHAVCLLMYYIIQTLTLHSRYLLEVKGVCYILGPSQFYFHLAPLSWLNAMSIDVLFAFLNLRPVGSTDNNLKKFIFYSLYGWGVPICVFLITVTVDFLQDVEDRPIGKIWCVKGRFRNWFFKTSATFTLIVINAIIFSYTAIKICILKKQTSVLHSQDSRRHSRDVENSNTRTKMYLRLLLLMGFHWILEPVTKALHNSMRLDPRLGIRVIWYVIALVNRLQGLFILLLFAGNDKLTEVVWMKFSNSKICKKLTDQASNKKPRISNISLNKISQNNCPHKSSDSKEKNKKELSNSRKTDPGEVSEIIPFILPDPKIG